jgi:hypothetical protein
MRSPCCLCIPPLNFRIHEPVFMKLGKYITTPEPISTAYFINPSHQSVCMYISPTVARQRLGKHVPSAMNTRKNRKIVGHVIFYAVHTVSKESLWVCVSVLIVARQRLDKHVPRQQRIVRGVVFYAVRVVSKESKRLVLPRTSFI